MHRSVTVTLRRREQPSEQAWSAALELVGRAGAQVQPSSVTGTIAVEYRFDSEQDRLLLWLLEELRRAGRVSGVAWRDYRILETDPDDFRTGDLFVVAGVGLNDQAGPFLVNPEDSLGPARACPHCGTTTEANRPVMGTLRIDETRLHQSAWTAGPFSPAGEYLEPPPAGWDLITLPNSALIASPRVVHALEGCAAGNWSTRPVAAAAGTPSTMVLLEAASRGGQPCEVHSRLGPPGACGSCGIVLGDRNFPVPLHVRASELGNRDIISLGLYPGGPLAMTRRVVDALFERGIAGLNCLEPRRICAH